MSQKTNPLSLRLQKGNRHFSSPWFTDSFFSDTFQYELMIRKYIAFLLQQTQYSLAFLSTKKHYRKQDIVFSIQDIRAEKKEKQLLFNLKSSLSYKKTLSENFLPSKPVSIVSTKRSTNIFRKKVRNDLLKFKLNPIKTIDNLFTLSKAFITTPYHLPSMHCCVTTIDHGPVIMHPSLGEIDHSKRMMHWDATPIDHGFAMMQSIDNALLSALKRVTVEKSNKVLSKPFFKDRIKQSSFLTYCEKIIEQEKLKQHNQEKFVSTLCFEPIRFVNTAQSVTPLLDRIVSLLEKRVSFKDIKVKAFRDVENIEFIKGIRFTCSGRLGGRSKKAQKAKMQTYQWGETTLNAFSSNVVFGSKSASTPYGKVGVKIWLSFTF